MTMDAYLNGTVIDGSGYVFSTTQGEGKIGAEGSTKEYKLTLDLKRGDEVCLVFEYSTENRGNIENLTATLNYLAAGETPDSPEDSTTTTTPPVSDTETNPPVSDTESSETDTVPPVSETDPAPSETDPTVETSPDEQTTDGNGSVTTPDDTSSAGNGQEVLKPTYNLGVILAVVIPFAIIAVIVVIVVTKKK
jgi:hypothetical protein